MLKKLIKKIQIEWILHKTFNSLLTNKQRRERNITVILFGLLGAVLGIAIKFIF